MNQSARLGELLDRVEGLRTPKAGDNIRADMLGQSVEAYARYRGASDSIAERLSPEEARVLGFDHHALSAVDLENDLVPLANFLPLLKESFDSEVQKFSSGLRRVAERLLDPGHEEAENVLTKHERSELRNCMELCDGVTRRAEHLLLIVATDRAVDKAAEARHELETAHDEIERITGELKEAKSADANRELAGQYEALAGREKRSSNFFRAFTGALLVAAVGFGVTAYGLQSDTTETSTIAQLVGHAIAAFALVSGGAYTARLAQQHRAISDWCQSVAVQLKTFERFTINIEDAALKARIHEDFARRALGAPPAPDGGSNDSASISTAQILDLVRLLQRP